MASGNGFRTLKIAKNGDKCIFQTMEGFYGKTPQYFEILLEKLNQKLQKTVEDVGD